MSILERPELPPGASALTTSERCAIALAAIGHRSGEIAGKLVEARLPVPTTGLGPIWSGAANKLGAQRSRPQGRQSELVFRARVHGLLDAPDPDDPGWIPPDVLDFLQALARGRTLKEYALVDLKVPVWDVDDIADHARKLLGRPPTQASMVYRALPQLLPTVQPPVDDASKELLRVARPSLITISLKTELPGGDMAVAMSRWWIRGCLPALGWHGSVLQADEVITHLVENGLSHGLLDESTPKNPLLVRAAVTEPGDLLLDVTDLNPSFPGFAAARKGERGRGLLRVTQLGARLTWFLHHEGPGKTVRAVLPPGPIDP